MAVSHNKKLHHLQTKWTMNSTTVISLFLLQEDAPYLWRWGRRERQAFNCPGKQGKLKIHFSKQLKKKRGKKKRKKKRHHGCKTQQNHAWNPSETEMKAHSLQGTEETARHGWMGRCSSHHGIHRAAKLNREDWHNFNCNNFFMNN